MAVAPWIVSDGLWELLEPLLPRVERRFRYPGCKRLPDREALQGILFVLHTGIAWRHLPLELGCRRRRERRVAGRSASLPARAAAPAGAAGATWTGASRPRAVGRATCRSGWPARERES